MFLFTHSLFFLLTHCSVIFRLIFKSCKSAEAWCRKLCRFTTKTVFTHKDRNMHRCSFHQVYEEAPTSDFVLHISVMMKMSLCAEASFPQFAMNESRNTLNISLHIAGSACSTTHDTCNYEEQTVLLIGCIGEVLSTHHHYTLLWPGL